MSQARRHLAKYGPPALAVLVALVVAALSSATVLWLDVGSAGDGRYVDGFYRSEANRHESFRWSLGESSLALPLGDGGTYRVDLALAVFEPSGRTLEIQCGESRHTFPLDGQAGNGVLSFDCRWDGDATTLELDVPTFQLGADARELGVSVRDVRVTALDTGEVWLFRGGVAMVVVATLVGLWLAAGSLGLQRLKLALTAVLGAGWLALVIARPEWMLSTVAGPAGVLVLSGGVVAWSLARGSVKQARIVAVIGVLVLVAMQQRSLALTLPSRWVDGDISALRLLPWLAGGAILVAALDGTRRSRYLAVAGSVVGLTATYVPILAKLVADRWAFALAVPDWTDRASVVGAVYLLAVLLVTVIGVATGRHRHVLGIVPVVALGLAGLLGWRVAVMNFNGDEPHYYVTARSLGADGDLELLNNYHEASYRRNTISPDGNIAVQRDASADRYSVLFPPDVEDRWYLDGEPGTVSVADGSAEQLPPLSAGSSVTLVFSGECAVDEVSVGTTDGGQRDLLLTLRDSDGRIAWEAEREISDAGNIPVSGVCGAGPKSLTIDSEGGPIVAQAVDTFAGLRVLPAREVGGVSILGSLPHDRYASRQAITELAIHNPTSAPIEALVNLLGPETSEPTEIPVEIPARGTRVLHLRSRGYDAAQVEPSDRLVVQGIGRIWAGAYALPEPTQLDQWSLTVPADGRHDAGIWLNLANGGGSEAQVTLADGEERQVVTLCGGCFETVLVAAEDEARDVVVSTSSLDISASAVSYQERTGALHFDPGLPLLAALPARIGGPKAVLIVPLLAAIAMAPGLVLLLRKVGVGAQLAAFCAVGMVILAPVSTYAVRLYTEIVAACLLVWAVVLWDAAGRRARYLVPLTAIILLLPVLHGRFVVFSLAFGGLIVLQGLRQARRLDRRTLSGLLGALIVVGLLMVALLQLTVGLRERVTASYIATNWADVGLVGVLLDRGSGLLPVAPWLMLAVFVARPLQPVQRVALGLVLLHLAAVIVRAGGWQTWGAPARYILPVVPLLALLVGPAVQRLWERRAARPAVLAVVGWGAVTTFMLHWLPLSGYVRGGRYLVDEAWNGVPVLSPMALFPKIAPSPGSFLVGTMLTFGLLGIGGWLLVMRRSTPIETPQWDVSTTDEAASYAMDSS